MTSHLLMEMQLIYFQIFLFYFLIKEGYLRWHKNIILILMLDTSILFVYRLIRRIILIQYQKFRNKIDTFKILKPF